ncbi:MAG: hypothetical protein VYA95_04870 [Candidatus Thermoplasmatota archaeon]|nr:hypothetical protein [Candidatus Thermoplasmatota archaeon]DAC51752.1 MAG TPA: hypothetical protein D7H84_06415 [Candidatus Poseidoniales archaeon]DAC61802.1 MAG TPA: hypothetical protein D7I03_00100 [Candidatus Poseidoniales archaeon]HII23874.1 hypothetical protein [Candidatus Poseidoniaceae archaeon]HII49712.1 hypothetical protein [Candidatus Poseidoniaceae archaeon]|tara:strand:+ start:1666 stop:1875 length:210 start_codon:yes stop_codon:yes gene_type:complete
MPHDNVQLAQAPNGEIGPRCKKCGIRMTFGAAMVIDNNYYCWKCYVEETGAESATTIVEAEQRFWMTNE